MIDLTDTTMLISVEGDPFDLDLMSTPVNQLARVMCSGPDGTTACERCRGVALRLLLIGDVRIEARRANGHQHEEWQLLDSAKGGRYCGACGEHVP